MKYGRQANGTQRYPCNNPDCARRIFLVHYHDKGRWPAIKPQNIPNAPETPDTQDAVVFTIDPDA
jgi:hypothetical protein